ncbi:DUF1549 and DUF1553 domain-containing protein [Humisphaera borealis]|nr:DUF1549 and DUF1553 domain-containing protein [Humisphaera borealis]
MRHDDEIDLRMPPKLRLPDVVTADFVKWVKLGAPWPAQAVVAAAPRAALDPAAARKSHWAWQPLRKPAVPSADPAWVRTPIDAFIFDKLQAKGLRPSPPAERRTLLRRVYLDLIGLPPSPDEVQKFLADSSPTAMEKVVDDLLSRPQYGERWGRHWLDIARYAESQGYERDEPKPFTWRYRDYVIRALNEDKPYDRFVFEQLAGDEIPGADLNTQAAATFLRLGIFDTIAADGKVARYDQLDDVVGTVTAAFLGQSLRCARCHNHKFEPYSQTDYYRILAVFDPLSTDRPRETRLAGSKAELADYEKALAAFELEIAPLQDKLDAERVAILEPLGAGYYSDKSKERTPRDEKKPRVSQEVLSAFKTPPAKRDATERELVEKNRRRLGDEIRKLATADQRKADEASQKAIDQLEAKKPKGPQVYLFTETAKPLSTKLFLRGDPHKIGPTVEVGLPPLWGGSPQATPAPVTQDVLTPSSGRRTWLANWMITDGKGTLARVIANRVWQYHFGRGIVATSNDFGLAGDKPTHPELLDWLAADLIDGGWKLKRLHRQIVLSAVYQQSAGYAQIPDADPDNDLLWRWPTRRLESEAIRDSMLAVSGKLNPEMFGPPIFPPAAQRVVGTSAQSDWGNSDDREASRRSVYVFQKRSIPLPELEILGIPDSTMSTDVRPVATTALQALLLMNSRFASEQAATLAERVAKEAGNDPTAQVNRAFELAMARPPRTEELEAALAYLATSAEPEIKASVKLSPLGSFCLVLLNSNEFLYVN